MKAKLLLALGLLCGLGVTACIEKQPIDYEYYHQTHGVAYQEGGESPFTEEEIAQAQKDEEALEQALKDTSSQKNPALWENEMRRICITELGFPLGTTSYQACRSFYDQQVYQYGIDTDVITAAQIAAFLTWTNPIIHRCHGFGYTGDILWGCVYDGEYRHFRAWSYHHPHYRRWNGPYYRPAPRPHHARPAPKPHHGHTPKPHHAKPAPKPHHAGPAKGPSHHSPKPAGGPSKPAGGASKPAPGGHK